MAGNEVCTRVVQGSSLPRSLETIVNPGSYNGLIVDYVCKSGPREPSTKHSFFLINVSPHFDFIWRGAYVIFINSQFPITQEMFCLHVRFQSFVGVGWMRRAAPINVSDWMVWSVCSSNRQSVLKIARLAQCFLIQSSFHHHLMLADCWFDFENQPCTCTVWFWSRSRGLNHSSWIYLQV